jgi:hypothetical protein
LLCKSFLVSLLVGLRLGRHALHSLEVISIRTLPARPHAFDCAYVARYVNSLRGRDSPHLAQVLICILMPYRLGLTGPLGFVTGPPFRELTH